VSQIQTQFYQLLMLTRSLFDFITEIEFADEEGSSKGRIIFPCGLQANTMFNDVIDLVHVDPERYPLHIDGESPVPLNRTGIAWASDNNKFKNHKLFDNAKHPIWTKFTKPWGNAFAKTIILPKRKRYSFVI